MISVELVIQLQFSHVVCFRKRLCNPDECHSSLATATAFAQTIGLALPVWKAASACYRGRINAMNRTAAVQYSDLYRPDASS